MLPLVAGYLSDQQHSARGGADLWLLNEGRIEELQLCPDGIVVANGVWRGAVNHVHQHLAALCVPQKLVPQPNARMSTLQKSCHITVRELAPSQYPWACPASKQSRAVLHNGCP